MSRNPNAPKPQNAPCDSLQFAQESQYYEQGFKPDGWIPEVDRSTFRGGDAGRFRNDSTANQVSREGDLSGFNVLGEQDDRGQYSGQQVETVYVDDSRADRGKES